MSVFVTIGVCTKNAEKVIEDCITSITCQKYPVNLMHIIIVDGCSTDKTIHLIVSTISKTNSIVEILSDEGKGLGAARKIAIDHAKGKYVVFVDADVKLFDNFVQKHVEFMEENPMFGVAFGRPMHQKGTLVSSVWDLYHYAAGGFIGTDATIFRSEAIAQAGGFDPDISGAGEDMDLISRIKAGGWLIGINKEAKFFHKFKENLKEFWAEQSWFGYGDHFRSHKNENMNVATRALLGGSLIFGLRMAMKAYDLTHKKISFLIPFQMVFKDIAWWFGFIRGHVDNYGHQKS